jgi:hypothetical protein
MITVTEPVEPVRFQYGGVEFQVHIGEDKRLFVVVTGRGNGRMRIEPSSHTSCTIMVENETRSK